MENFSKSSHGQKKINEIFSSSLNSESISKILLHLLIISLKYRKFLQVPSYQQKKKSEIRPSPLMTRWKYRKFLQVPLQFGGMSANFSKYPYHSEKSIEHFFKSLSIKRTGILGHRIHLCNLLFDKFSYQLNSPGNLTNSCTVILISTQDICYPLCPSDFVLPDLPLPPPL